MEKWSFLKNIYVKNLLGLILVSILLVVLVLNGLKRYTQHGRAVEVPNIKGITIEKAKPLLTRTNLHFVVIDSVFIKNAVPGTISEIIPPVGSMVKEGRTIYLKVVAFLPQLIAIPDVKDTSQRQSYAILKSLGFEKIEIKMVPGLYRDLVMGIESKGVPLKAGQRVPASTPISLLVSSGSDDILFLENPAINEIDWDQIPVLTNDGELD